MVLLNGRMRSYSRSRNSQFTCFKYNGASAGDYVIADYDILNAVKQFDVKHKTPDSDHCPLTYILSNGYIQTNTQIEKISSTLYLYSGIRKRQINILKACNAQSHGDTSIIFSVTLWITIWTAIKSYNFFISILKTWYRKPLRSDVENLRLRSLRIRGSMPSVRNSKMRCMQQSHVIINHRRSAKSEGATSKLHSAKKAIPPRLSSWSWTNAYRKPNGVLGILATVP